MPAAESTAATLIVAEPLSRYGKHPPLVVDCSVVCALLFQEPEREQARVCMAGRALHAPQLLDYEFGSVAVTKLRTGERSDVDDGLRAFSRMEIVAHAIDVASTVALAERHGLSAYDAAYLWLAGTLRAPLATFDRRLGEIARQYLGSLDADTA